MTITRRTLPQGSLRAWDNSIFTSLAVEAVREILISGFQEALMLVIPAFAYFKLLSMEQIETDEGRDGA